MWHLYKLHAGGAVVVALRSITTLAGDGIPVLPTPELASKANQIAPHRYGTCTQESPGRMRYKCPPRIRTGASS